MRELPRLFAKSRIPRTDAERLAAQVKALADPSRIQMLSILLDRPSMGVQELVDAVGHLKQPTVSHHLAILAAAGLVSSHRDGVYRRFSVDWSGLHALSDAIRPGVRR
jgi:ArsR family transcriptional regulator